MPQEWMDGVLQHPGRSANPNRPGGAGLLDRMVWFKHHDTAGLNSYEVCRWGRPGYNASLCTFLVPKEGTPWQFAPFNALCYDSGTWNEWGPSMEVERLGVGQVFNGNVLAVKQPLTGSQEDWIGTINLWAHDEWGIPNVQYRGPQFGALDFVGHVSHYDIAYNPDGLTYAEWDAVTNGATESPVKPKEEEYPMEVVAVMIGGLMDYFWVDEKGRLLWKHTDANGTVHGPTVVTVNANKDRPLISKFDTWAGPILYFRGPQLQPVRARISGWQWIAEYV